MDRRLISQYLIGGMKMQNDKLLPCPFCGGELKFSEILHIAICNECDAHIGFPKLSSNKSKVINAINTRKPMERIVEQLEEKSNLNHLEKMEERVGKKQTQGFGLGIRCAIDIVKGWCR